MNVGEHCQPADTRKKWHAGGAFGEPRTGVTKVVRGQGLYLHLTFDPFQGVGGIDPLQAPVLLSW